MDMLTWILVSLIGGLALGVGHGFVTGLMTRRHDVLVTFTDPRDDITFSIQMNDISDIRIERVVGHIIEGGSRMLLAERRKHVS